ncbi:hypothetical protein F2Q69_00054354 [Brassica cretica]|uniref:Uncharacterized protein n=1 Tax=Brassica cretica TaxID=69181 RepID=A0A8S9MRL0_BRACR|nr:hypothetical protein F2Q69_00054354 [Brassica cretica]
MNGGEEFSNDGSKLGEKKRRLNMEQLKTLEKNFERGADIVVEVLPSVGRLKSRFRGSLARDQVNSKKETCAFYFLHFIHSDLTALTSSTVFTTTTTMQFFQNFSSEQRMVKEENSISNMLCGIDDQYGFWPWLDQQHYN